MTDLYIKLNTYPHHPQCHLRLAADFRHFQEHFAARLLEAGHLERLVLNFQKNEIITCSL